MIDKLSIIFLRLLSDIFYPGLINWY